jgi:hypothetical protein
LVGLFFAKSSLDGEESKRQTKMKMKKKRKKVVGKSLWSFSRSQEKLHGFVLCIKGVRVKIFAKKNLPSFFQC